MNVTKKLHDRLNVVTLGETFAIGKSPLGEYRIWVKKAVTGNNGDVETGVVTKLLRQVCAEGAFPDGDASGDAKHESRSFLVVRVANEGDNRIKALLGHISTLRGRR